MVTESKILGSYENDVIIYVPNSYTFDDIKIESGLGKINLYNLSTNKLSMELGAGKVNIDTIKIIDEADIDGGAGEVNIINSNISNLDLEMGIGKFNIKATFNGHNEIDAGVGELNIELLDGKNNYTITAEKGIGNIKLDGDTVYNNVRYGNGRIL